MDSLLEGPTHTGACPSCQTERQSPRGLEIPPPRLPSEPVADSEFKPDFPDLSLVQCLRLLVAPHPSCCLWYLPALLLQGAALGTADRGSKY